MPILDGFTLPTDQPNERPSITNLRYADYLEYGFELDLGETPFVWNLQDHELQNLFLRTFPKAGQIKFNVTGWDDKHYGLGPDSDGLTAEHRRLAREAFKLYQEHLGIDFIETAGDDADIYFMDNSDNKGYSSRTPKYNDRFLAKTYPENSFINITLDQDEKTTLDSSLFSTYIHEIGHSLGLGHDGNYNYSDANPSASNYINAGKYLNSSQQSTMMSYFRVPSSENKSRWGGYVNTNIKADFIETNTPMPVDWLALDNMYKDQGFGISNSFNGDTRYGVNTNISADTSEVWTNFSDFITTNAFTIVDGSGYDIIDVSFSDSDQEIDLRQVDPNSDSLYSSDIAGRKGNLYIAASTVIEEAITGAGDDILIGNADDNTLNGGAGSDQLWGLEGANTLKSGDLDGYADELYVHAGNSQQKRDLLIQVDATDRIYIDGIKDDELTFKSNIDDPTGSNYVGIGIYANGVLEALVVDSALTESQISDITSAGEFS